MKTRTKEDRYQQIKWTLICFGCLIAFGFVMLLVDEHHFNSMTPAQHFNAAKAEPHKLLSDIQEARRHLAAIPQNSPEATAASALDEELSREEESLRQAEATRVQANSNRIFSIQQLQRDLRNLGYDLTVEASSDPAEIVITSSDFADTDHRVRFLAFMRSSSAPTFNVCWNRFNQIRLKSSRVAVIGFNEAYPLSCER